jgi:hypothetical protein
LVPPEPAEDELLLLLLHAVPRKTSVIASTNDAETRLLRMSESAPSRKLTD